MARVHPIEFTDVQRAGSIAALSIPPEPSEISGLEAAFSFLSRADNTMSFSRTLSVSSVYSALFRADDSSVSLSRQSSAQSELDDEHTDEPVAAGGPPPSPHPTLLGRFCKAAFSVRSIVQKVKRQARSRRKGRKESHAVFSPANLSKARIWLAAYVSLADYASDVYTISVYYMVGMTDVASALLATVIFSTTLQIVLVIFVHRHRGFLPVLLEVLTVLSGFKPLVDTRRMLSGHEVEGAPMHINNERTGCKMIEMVIEAVPSAVIVIRSTLASGVTSFVPLLSILISLLTIATTSTGIFFGFDLDPGSRLFSPMFYGCVRDTALHQALTRVALYLFTLAHATAKLLTISVLLELNKTALAVYLTGTMALFLVAKVGRKNFYYWPPRTGFKVALTTRVVAKIFVDVTANPHYRHPFELGGAGWFATILETLFSFIATCIAYALSYEGENKMADAMVFGVLVVVLAVWIASLGTFLLTVNRTHVHTFYSLETGPQFLERQFLHHVGPGNDEVRMEVFRNNERLYGPSLRTAIVSWVHASYTAWNSQAWFTPAVRAIIPIWAIPSVLEQTTNAEPESGTLQSAARSAD